MWVALDEMKLTPFNFGSGVFQVPPSAEEGKEDFDLLNPQGARYLRS